MRGVDARPLLAAEDADHACAHLLLAGGVPDAVALEILGHADPAILRRYQAVDPRLKIEAMRKLDDLLGR
jgi:hypothetical protein